MLTMLFQGKRVGAIGLLLGVSALLIIGCNTMAKTAEAVPEASRSGKAVPPSVSVNALMVALIDHAGHELWNVEQKGQAPKTEAQWEEIEHHAIQLAAAGTLLAMGGTGPSDQAWAQSPDWKKFSGRLSEAGLSAREAAHSRNLETLVKANGQLVQVCEDCHKQYKPEVPTEGLAHPHYRE